MSSTRPTAPVITAGVITAGVTAILTLLVAFGVPLTKDQQVAILGVVGVAAPIIVAYVGNRTTAEFSLAGSIYRGVANEGVTGEYVREIGATAPDLTDQCSRPGPFVYCDDPTCPLHGALPAP